MLLLLLNKWGSCIKMVPFHQLESNLTNMSLNLECFFFRWSNILLLILNKQGFCKKMVPFQQLEFILTNLSLVLEWFLFSFVKYIAVKKNVMIFFRSLWYLSGRSLAVVFCALAHTALQYYSRWWLATKVTKAMDRSCSPQDEILKFWFLI